MTFLAFIPILSVMMIAHELGHYVTARLSGITIEEFGLGLPPRLWGFKRGGVIYSINWLPFGAFVRMQGEEDPTSPGSFAAKPRWVRAIVLAAGAGMNFVLAVAAFSLAFIIGMPQVTLNGPARLEAVQAASPAAQAGLRVGDRIVAFDGQPVASGTRFQQLTESHLGQVVDLTVDRGGQTLQVTLTPRPNPPAGQGAMGVALHGTTEVVRWGFFPAIADGFHVAWGVVAQTLQLPALLLQGTLTPAEARPVGLVGMAQLMGQAVGVAASSGFWFPVLVLTGIFSAGLSVANLLPIPALDGGRLLFVAIEWLRGRRVAPEKEAAYHVVGIVVLLTLMLLISFNDLRSPLPPINWGVR